MNLILKVLIGITTLALASNASADENLPRGLGHNNNPAHWYDAGCCNMKDCEPVEPGAIRETPQGYYVKYLTSRGFIAEGLVPYGSSSIRPSRDEREHACSIAQRVICIYIPFSS